MNCSYFSNLWGNRKNKNRYFVAKCKIGQGLARIPNLTATVSMDNFSIKWDSVLSIPRFSWISRENDNWGWAAISVPMPFVGESEAKAYYGEKNRPWEFRSLPDKMAIKDLGLALFTCSCWYSG